MTVTFLTGDCVESMRGIADGSVQCVVTSPPYWRLRDYGHDKQIGLEKTPDEYVQIMVKHGGCCAMTGRCGLMSGILTQAAVAEVIRPTAGTASRRRTWAALWRRPLCHLA